MKCLNCNKETVNPKFCSKSCAAIYNNKKFPKRKKISKCIECGQLVTSRRKYCQDCLIKKQKESDNKTLEEVMYDKHHKSSNWALVRSRARVIMSKELQICCKCGYDKHVEVAHIKPINSFPLTTLVKVVNDKSNLMLLCPNCHWEYDHNLI